MKKIDSTKLRAIVLCFLSVLCGAVLCALRLKVLFGAYDPSTGLYPNCPDTSAFETGMIALPLSIALGGLVFAFKKSYCIARLAVPRAFSGAFLGFSFLALGASTFLASKINALPLSRFEGVLIVLSLVCAVSFFAEAFAKGEGLGKDAASVMMLFRPVCCLFISFFFYFNSATVIHDSNKKMATLFFAVALLSLLCEVKLRISKVRMQLYASLCALSLCYSVMYSIPNLVWYFTRGEELMISVFFDIVAAALGIWSAVCILSIRELEAPAKESPCSCEGACADEEINEPSKDSEPVAEPSLQNADAEGCGEHRPQELSETETAEDGEENSDSDDPKEISDVRETET